MYSKTCRKRPLKKEDQKLVFKAYYRLMQVESIAVEHSAILLTFIKLPFVIKVFALSIFEWLLKTGLTVSCNPCNSRMFSEPARLCNSSIF